MMKKSALMIVSLLFVALVAVAQQKDKRAEQILNEVSAKYKSYKTVQADFTFTVEQSNNVPQSTQSGTIYLEGNRYKLTLDEQEIICDSRTIWTYLKEANEVQISSFEANEDNIAPTDLFTIYEKDFLYGFVEERNVAGKTFQIIDLTPNDKSKSYFKVRLSIDKTAKSIRSAEIFEKSGNRYTYEIKKFIANPVFPAAFFSFDTSKYPGIEVVDLR